MVRSSRNLVRLLLGKPAIRLYLASLLCLVLIPSVMAVTTSSYTISPGDKLNVMVFGEPDLSVSSAPVSSNGTITIPLLGQVHVEGMTVGQLEQRLTSLFQNGYLRDPKVSVNLAEYRPFYISGAVSRTGEVRFKEGLTVARAVVLAGGFTEAAVEDKIKIIRSVGGQEVILEAGPETEIQPGDVIEVESREALGLVFYVHGEVARPGAYGYKQDLTVEKAITIAGGFGKRASKRKIEIVRDTDPERKPVKVKLGDMVEPGDVITVGTSLF